MVLLFTSNFASLSLFKNASTEMRNHLHQQDEEDEEQEFYESLDRIVSSSCSSTSCSDDDGGGDPRPCRILRFPPPAATSYDLWISEPSSIEDRRRRFLRHMGLFGDPTLSRQKSLLQSRSDADRIQNVEVTRTVNRSRSDSAVDLRSDGDGNGKGDGYLDRRCTIKNLDNGEEFVVREDGMWNRMRDLTIEEFELCIGRSPIVQELMRRQNVEDSCSNGGFCNQNGGFCSQNGGFYNQNGGLRSGPCKKKGGWLKSIKQIAGNVVAGGYYRERRNSVSKDPKDLSSEKGSRRLSSGTDDSQDGGSHCGLERIRVRQYGKSFKEFTGVYMTQEIQAHNGSIWCIKFSLDGKFLASAGEDCVIHVWQVSENGGSNESSESDLALTCAEGSHWERKRRARLSNGRKSVSSDHLVVPDQLFALGENPACSFKGHLDDVLDLSWSKSEYLLSSSMDKTVRLWHMSSDSCLKVFSHTDYVTCIQFNPVDDRYFISGSLDQKVRIWSIPDRQIVDWNDLHAMVTAACYTPDGQGAFVGSHKGSCHLYNISDNKLHLRSQIDLQNSIKKSSHKKITGFQFAPGSLSEVLITSADSRIRVVDGTEIVHKFKGFRNTSSQISASLSTNGKYVVCASEDSHVYIWRYDSDTQRNRSRGVASITQSYEHFHCRDVTVAITWPKSTSSRAVSRCNSQQSSILDTSINPFGDRVTSTWPEEKLLTSSNHGTPRNSVDFSNDRLQLQSRSAWGMVIVTAGRSGKIKTFQNFSFPF